MSEAQQHQQLLELHNQMFMSPQDFSYRWGLGYEELAKICAISKYYGLSLVGWTSQPPRSWITLSANYGCG